MRPIVVVVALSLPFAGCATAPPPQKHERSVPRTLALARDHYASMRYGEALFAYLCTLSVAPRSEEARLGVARCAWITSPSGRNRVQRLAEDPLPAFDRGCQALARLVLADALRRTARWRS